MEELNSSSNSATNYTLNLEVYIVKLNKKKLKSTNPIQLWPFDRIEEYCLHPKYIYECPTFRLIIQKFQKGNLNRCRSFLTQFSF